MVNKMSTKIKFCEICGDEFTTEHAQQKYCEKCGKNPERTRKEYEWAAERLVRHAGLNDMPKKQICENCGKEFLSAYMRKTCSDSCEKEYDIKTAKCEICKTLLIEHGNYDGYGTCSEECRQKLILKKEEDRIIKAKIEGDYVPCEWCKKDFVRRNYSNIFCGKECLDSYNEYRRKRKMEENAKKISSPEYIAAHTIESRLCAYCGKEFTCEHYIVKMYCSKECREKGTKQRSMTRQRKQES